MHTWEGCVLGTPTHHDRAAEVAWEPAEQGVAVTELWSSVARRKGKLSLGEEEEEARPWCVRPAQHGVCSRLCCWLVGPEACAWLGWQLALSLLK